MRKEDALRLIRRGEYSTWNAHRKENPEWMPDLSYEVIGDANVSHFDLRGANIRGTNFCGADFDEGGYVARFESAVFNIDTTFPDGYSGAELGCVFDPRPVKSHKLPTNARLRPPDKRPKKRTSSVGKRMANRRVFIGHGRASDWRELKDFLQSDLGLHCVEFNSESAAGRPTVDRLKEMLSESSFAFLVLTSEDEHSDGTRHPRENVVHEAGLFQGKLGFERAIILLERGCAEFSNIHGLTHIPFARGEIRAAFHDIRRALERENVV